MVSGQCAYIGVFRTPQNNISTLAATYVQNTDIVRFVLKQMDEAFFKSAENNRYEAVADSEMVYDEENHTLVQGDETNARGNDTVYEVDPATSQNRAAIDRCGYRTEYTYDVLDNLTGIVRGDGMKYVLDYNEFHNLSTVRVEGRNAPLVAYAYKSGNGRLKQVFYANNDNMKATYNALGQLVAEKWYDANEVLTAHYQYGYDGAGNIVRTVDIFAQREYTYTYEAGVLVRATEYAVTFDESGFIVARSVVSALRYFYDEQGTLVRKSVTFADGMEQITLFDTDEDDCVTTQLQVNGEYIPCISKADSFGRKEYDELQLGRGFLSRRFSYHEGKITAEHQGNAKIKSVPTTHLVSRIDFSDGRSLSYEYDAEERITKVVESDGESFVSTTAYTYDAQGQLLTETVNGNLVNEMTYDGYGNILTKNDKAYTYGDAAWKDLLTAYDGQTIAYDAQGNPTNYLGHTLAWEKGRQLKSFDDISYTYNANGIRTSKIVDGVEHTYVLDGAKILRETWGINELVPLYDNEDSVCGILYNQVPYYFRKNLQGDIIAITDKYGETVARYTYDAWGKCTIVDLARAHEIATINPFRYRSYYYDSETQLYYLQSRYYDPTLGRFVNSDEVALVSIPESSCENNLFAYCCNNSVNKNDPFGFFAAEAIALKFVSAAGIAGASNSWNVVGWVILAVVLIIVVGLAIFRSIKAVKRAQQDALVQATLLMNFASTAATPPPPNKGGKGTKVTSKTLYNKRGKNGYRIDVENPGNRTGQIHLQKNGVKYYYNIKAQEFRIGSSSGKLAPKAIQNLLKDPNVIKAIAKGLQILGY